ncbi:MAG TPA: hypothetical protein VHM26_09910 [Chitinophagaceae bacterium]|jgi:hypothetical protein|nr:hypothetical protein [Chitinophagaceae bacterium]
MGKRFAHYLPLTFLLFIAHCPLPIAYCPLLVDGFFQSMQPIRNPVSQSKRPAGGHQNQRVKKFAAIIFFATLFVAQYARYGGYVECRFSNWIASSFSPSSAKCDCDKWLADVSAGDEQPPIPFHHQHYHLDELFIVMDDSSSDGAFFITTDFSNLNISLEEGVYSLLYRPPVGQ